MLVSYKINNYVLGAYFKCTNQKYLVSKERVDSRYTVVKYNVPNEKTKSIIDKMLGYKGVVEEV